MDLKLCLLKSSFEILLLKSELQAGQKHTRQNELINSACVLDGTKKRRTLKTKSCVSEK